MGVGWLEVWVALIRVGGRDGRGQIGMIWVLR